MPLENEIKTDASPEAPMSIWQKGRTLIVRRLTRKETATTKETQRPARPDWMSSVVRLNSEHPEAVRAAIWYGFGILVFGIVTVLFGWRYYATIAPDGTVVSFWESLFASCVSTLAFAASAGIVGFIASIRSSSDLPMRQRVVIMLNAKSIDLNYVKEVEKQINGLIIISDKTETDLRFGEYSPCGGAVKMHVTLRRSF
jgi:hypothetical protein